MAPRRSRHLSMLPEGTLPEEASQVEDYMGGLDELLGQLEMAPTPEAPRENILRNIAGALSDALTARSTVLAGGVPPRMGAFTAQRAERQQARTDAEMAAATYNRELRNRVRIGAFEKQQSQEGKVELANMAAERDAARNELTLRRIENEMYRTQIMAQNARTAGEKADWQRQFDMLQLDFQNRKLAQEKELEEAKLRKQARMNPTLFKEKRETRVLLDNVKAARELVNQGVGGPLEGRLSRVSPNPATRAKLARLRAIFADINTTVAPEKLGANIPPGERELIAGILVDKNSTLTDMLAALDQLESSYGKRLQMIEDEYMIGEGGTPGGVTVGPDGMLHFGGQ